MQKSNRFGKQLRTLLLKEIQLEWRARYVLNGVLLYLVSSIFVIYLSFQLNGVSIEPVVWNILFWIVQLFTAFNIVAKSFFQERYNRFFYYYTLFSPEVLIISKIIYNTLLMAGIGLLGMLVFVVIMGNPIQDIAGFLICLVSASVGFSSTLTMVSGIASKAGNNTTLLAILGFPVILPLLLMTLRLSKNAIDGLDFSLQADKLLVIWAINLLTTALATLLFPYIWRS
ncbi:MAG TPA: ABC transporter permease [Microscillaceae bacterium]|jgi:heme exporter protein B|nr:ABC transporter permease [Microscillaceae bacterium]